MRNASRLCLNVFLLALLLGGVLVSGRPARAQGPAAASDPNEAVLLLNDAMGEYAMRRLNPARTRLEDLIKRFPNHPVTPRARLELARILKDLREFDRAIELLTTLATGPAGGFEAANAREMLLDLLYDLHRYKDGIDLLEKAWKEAPGHVETGRRLARFYLSAGRQDEARLLLEGLLERTARADVFNDLLQLAIRQGKVEALQSLIEQRRARYRTVDYLDFITDCHLALKQNEQAAALLREAKETAGELRLLRKLAQLDQARNDPERALQSLRLLQKMFPDQWEYAKAVGHCLFQLGRKDEAIATWRTHFQKRGGLGTEGFQLFAEVLIEHRLYPEALGAFEEARRVTGIPTQFAEEKAGVLEALGRTPEALEEYFLTLVNGLYKTDIFDKLYDSQSASFDLKTRLLEAQKTTPTLAVRRALLEVWFREADPVCLPDLLPMAANDGNVQEIICERIRQEAFVQPTPFLRVLLLGLIRQDRASSLALRLVLVLLTLPDQTDPQAAEALTEAGLVVDQPTVADLTLQNRVLVEMARLAWDRFARVPDALAWLARVADGPAAGAAPGVAFDALLLTMRLRTALGEMAAAEAALERARKVAGVVGPGRSPASRPGPTVVIGNGDGLPPVGEVPDGFDALFDSPDLGPEAESRLMYEEGWLLAHQGKYPEALDRLRQMTGSFPESLWMNDGLNLALTVTMGSVGDFEPLQKYLAAERASLVGSPAAALALLQEVARVASESALGLDAQGQALLQAERTADPAALQKEIDTFVRFHPNHWLGPDLWLAGWRLMRRNGATPEAIADHLKAFTDRFPGDLRSRRVKLALAGLMRAKSQSGAGPAPTAPTGKTASEASPPGASPRESTPVEKTPPQETQPAGTSPDKAPSPGDPPTDGPSQKGQGEKKP